MQLLGSKLIVVMMTFDQIQSTMAGQVSDQK